MQPVAGLDPGIEEIVNKLRAHGIETYESCEGGPGHAFAEPTVRFNCGLGGEWQALGVAIMLALPVVEVRQVWRIHRSGVGPEGPIWEMTFRLEAP
jgi:hypothetical protein